MISKAKNEHPPSDLSDDDNIEDESDKEFFYRCE